MAPILILFEEKTFLRYFTTGKTLTKITVKNLFLQIISIWMPFESSHQTVFFFHYLDQKYLFFGIELR